jgi:hypothetical protein
MIYLVQDSKDLYQFTWYSKIAKINHSEWTSYSYVLGQYWDFGLRALHLLGRHSTTWTMPQSFFELYLFFWRVLEFLPSPDLRPRFPTSASSIPGIIGMNNHAPFIWWNEVLLIFCSGCTWITIFLSSWDCRCVSQLLASRSYSWLLSLIYIFRDL